MTRKAQMGGVALSLSLAVLPACDMMGSEDAEERARLLQARSRWRAAGISDYSYEVRKLCFCPPEVVGPFAITVRGGAVASVVYVPTGAAVVPLAERHPTVDGLFAVVEATLERNPDRLTIDYDSALGYPRRIDVDTIVRAADDEVTYEAASLTRLN
jgi:Family of unknown function (DUF6174)